MANLKMKTIPKMMMTQKNKQARAELGQAQLKMGLDFTLDMVYLDLET